MTTNVKSNRSSQIAAWVAGSIFVLGFFRAQIGYWTGPILGVWFAGTQKPRRGFLWMMVFAFIPHLISDWRLFAQTGLRPAFEYAAWILLASLLAVLPFTFHRLVSPRLPGFISTLPFPLASAAIQFWCLPLLPSGAFMFLADDGAAKMPLLHVMKGIGGGPILLLLDASIFIGCWFATVVVWMWNNEFRASRVGRGAAFIGVLFGLLLGFGIYSRIRGVGLLNILPASVVTIWAWIPPAGGIALAIWALFARGKHKPWADRPQTVALLRSPFTGDPLHVVAEKGREALVSSSGERFPVRDGIPVFLRPEDLSGDNGKYNRLYETIGGFYDDTQRVVAAFRGLDIDSYFENYMSLLEVKPGDSVLETSVGTGLNFKYLPPEAKRSGLDLSPEMLTNCQNNLRRWQMDADLYLGNAESLPFAESSFDVVFSCGGFNFFSDRAKAIREMIRVVKPGGHLMIEDETEEYVKSTYEKSPITSGFYSKRKQAVTVPIDLVPPEMEETHLEMLKDGKFYAITFRKPLAMGPTAVGRTNPTGDLLATDSQTDCRMEP